MSGTKLSSRFSRLARGGGALSSVEPNFLQNVKIADRIKDLINPKDGFPIFKTLYNVGVFRLRASDRFLA